MSLILFNVLYRLFYKWLKGRRVRARRNNQIRRSDTKCFWNLFLTNFASRRNAGPIESFKIWATIDRLRVDRVGGHKQWIDTIWLIMGPNWAIIHPRTPTSLSVRQGFVQFVIIMADLLQMEQKVSSSVELIIIAALTTCFLIVSYHFKRKVTSKVSRVSEYFVSRFIFHDFLICSSWFR